MLTGHSQMLIDTNPQVYPWIHIMLQMGCSALQSGNLMHFADEQEVGDAGRILQALPCIQSNGQT